jgi:hypothetical protein
MEDILLAVGAFFLEVSVMIVLAAKRPLQYILSSSYRDELKAKWEGRYRILFYAHIFGGITVLVCAIAVIWFWGNSIFFAPEPDPTSTEVFKKEMKELLLDAAKKANESRSL